MGLHIESEIEETLEPEFVQDYILSDIKKVTMRNRSTQVDFPKMKKTKEYKEYNQLIKTICKNSNNFVHLLKYFEIVEYLDIYNFSTL